LFLLGSICRIFKPIYNSWRCIRIWRYSIIDWFEKCCGKLGVNQSTEKTWIRSCWFWNWYYSIKLFIWTKSIFVKQTKLDI